MTPRRVLAALARDWNRERRRVARRPDPEGVHRIRTATRRLRVAEALAADFLGIEGSAPWEEWRRVGRRLGRLRDLDVSIEELQAVATDLPAAARRALADLLEELGHRRRRAAHRAQASLTNRHARTLARAEKRVRGRARREEPTAPVVANRWWAQAADLLARDPGWGLDPAVAIGRAATRPVIHRLRVRTRDLRYGLEWWDRLGVPTAPGTLDFLREVQDVLGRLRDLRNATRLARGRTLAPVRARLRQAVATGLARWPALVLERPILAASPL